MSLLPNAQFLAFFNIAVQWTDGTYHLCNIEGTCPTEYVLSTDPDIYNKNKLDVSEWHEALQTVVRTMNNEWYQRQSDPKKGVREAEAVK